MDRLIAPIYHKAVSLAISHLSIFYLPIKYANMNGLQMQTNPVADSVP